MSLILDLPEPVLSKIAERASRVRKTPEELVLEVIEEWATKPYTFAEIMAPFAAAFEASGMTEEEFDALIEEVRQEIWEERQSAEATPNAIIETNGQSIPPPSET